MSHIRLIISDIDGTILNDHHQIDPQLASLIPDLKRGKIPFVLASARSPKRDGTHYPRKPAQKTVLWPATVGLVKEPGSVEHPQTRLEPVNLLDWAMPFSSGFDQPLQWKRLDDRSSRPMEPERGPGLQEKKYIILPLLHPLLDATKPLVLLVGA